MDARSTERKSSPRAAVTRASDRTSYDTRFGTNPSAPAASPDAQRLPHRRLRELAEELRAQGLHLDTLSMGMSDDLEAAIAEGSTLVRVGTAIFGARKP